MSKDKQLIIICLLALIVASLNIPEVGAVASGTTVRLEPVDSVVGLNETFAVQVMIEEANDLGAFEFELVYDSSILQVKEAALGDFLGSTGRSVVPIGPEVDNEEGRMIFGAISFPSEPGPSGTGVLATITCIARREGSTVLDLLKVQVLDTVTNAQLITVEGGRVIVGGAATPTPLATATAISTPTSTSKVVATPTLEATALPSLMPSVTILTAETPTQTPPPSPTLSVTIPTAETPTQTPSASPTPSVTSPTVETPTKAPPPPPTPSVSIAPTETRPTEVTTPLAVPTAETTQVPVTVTTAPAFTPATLPSPSPISRPSPTPLTTIPASTSTGPSSWVVLGPLLAALAVAILAVLVLRRRPEE